MNTTIFGVILGGTEDGPTSPYPVEDTHTGFHQLRQRPKVPPLNREYNRDPNIKALKTKGLFIMGLCPFIHAFNSPRHPPSGRSDPTTNANVLEAPGGPWSPLERPGSAWNPPTCMDEAE